MVLNWIMKRVLTPKRVEYLIKSNQKVISEAMKDSVQDLLEDQDIGLMVIAYTDQIYARYLGKGGKLWSTIGGVQGGINRQVDREMDKMNPFAGILDGGEELSLSSIAKGFLKNMFAQGLQAQNPGQPGQPSTARSKVVPNM